MARVARSCAGGAAAVAVVGVVAISGCASPGTREARQSAAVSGGKPSGEAAPGGGEAAAAARPKVPVLIGRVIAVNETEQFVLFETGSRRRDFPTGFLLEARPTDGGEPVPLRFSPENNARFGTADYQGEVMPRVGDLVFTVPVGGPPAPAVGAASAIITADDLEPVEPLEPIESSEALEQLIRGEL